MKPLTIVDPRNLQIGKQYLIEYAGPCFHSYPRCKGTFTGNTMPEYEYQCIRSKFNNIQDSMCRCSLKPDFEYSLQDCFYKYYEADALTRAYTKYVLRDITGDPDFDIE